MKLKYSLFLALCSLTPFTATAQATQNPPAIEKQGAIPKAKNLRLTVMPRALMKQTGRDNGRYDCGVVDILQTPQVERVFTLKNESDFPVALDAIRVSCGCQSSMILKNGQSVQQTRLSPGDEIEVRLGVNLIRVHSKEKRVTAWAHCREQIEPLAVMEMVMQLEPSVQFRPSALVFQHVGQSQSIMAICAQPPKM